MSKVWTCQRVSGGVKCGQANPLRRQICLKCGKKRPPRKRPAHAAVLNDPYAVWVEKFGEVCGICGRKPTAKRRLDRDHDHRDGHMRGLLCARCNRALPSWITIEWLEKAIAYLKKIV